MILVDDLRAVAVLRLGWFKSHPKRSTREGKKHLKLAANCVPFPVSAVLPFSNDARLKRGAKVVAATSRLLLLLLCIVGNDLDNITETVQSYSYCSDTPFS